MTPPLHLPVPTSVADQLPPPIWWPVVRPGMRVDPMGRDECLRLLGSRGTAGLSFTGMLGPRAVTTGYQMAGPAVVLGPLPLDVQETMAVRQLILFRVEHLDAGQQSGWTVVVVGTVAAAAYVELALGPVAGRCVAAAALRVPSTQG